MFKKHPRQIGAGTLCALNELLPSEGYMASSRVNPDHYTLALTGTTLQDAKIATCLPNNDTGELDQLGVQAHILNASSIWPDFSMPFWDDEKNLSFSWNDYQKNNIDRLLEKYE